MKERFTNQCKKCDVCSKQTDVVYDTKTKMGAWAYLCDNCFTTDSAIPMTSDAVTKLTHRAESAKPQDKTVRGILESNAWDSLTEGILEYSCPECGECRSVEPDASYAFNCEGCGVKVKVDAFNDCIDAVGDSEAPFDLDLII